MADDRDLMLLAQYNYAESANQDPEVWVANTYAALNRLKDGNYGETINDVVNGMSSAIKTNSDQWQLATGQKQRNAYEDNVYKKIVAKVSGVLKGTIDNPIDDATHFENVKDFGVPKWAKKMQKVGDVGDHTYWSTKLKDSVGESKATFNQAFAEARKQGLDEFEWRGKRYTTETK